MAKNTRVVTEHPHWMVGVKIPRGSKIASDKQEVYSFTKKIPSNLSLTLLLKSWVRFFTCSKPLEEKNTVWKAKAVVTQS